MTTEILIIEEDELLIDYITAQEILDLTQPSELLEAAIQGPPGRDGSGAIQFPFAWGDASPRQVLIAAANKLIYEVELHISEAFNGVGAQLTVGDAGQADRLMAAAQCDPATIGSYMSAPVRSYGADTAVLLTITPGIGATAGKGLLTINIQL